MNSAINTLQQEFLSLLEQEQMLPMERRITVAVSSNDEELLDTLSLAAMNQFPGLDITVTSLKIETADWTETLVNALCFDDLGEELLLLDTLLPNKTHLSSQEQEQLETALEVKINTVSLTSKELFFALLAREEPN